MAQLAAKLFDPIVFLHLVWDNTHVYPYRNSLVACTGILNLMDAVLYTTDERVNLKKVRWWQ
jgi:hypothetical protein